MLISGENLSVAKWGQFLGELEDRGIVDGEQYQLSGQADEGFFPDDLFDKYPELKEKFGFVETPVCWEVPEEDDDE